MSEFYIKNRKIGINYKPYFIADIAANHDGSLDRAKELIWLAAEAGADAAKFQNFTASTLVSDVGFENLPDLKTHQNSWKESVYEIYKKATIPIEWTEILYKTCEEAKIDYFTSIYDLSQIDYLNDYVCAWKIGSGDITWHSMIENCCKTKKPILIATGASNFIEIEMAANLISKYTEKFVLMQCNTNYTGSDDNFKFINLNVLKMFKNKFPQAILGLSDHTPGHSTVLGAIALGANVIEKHFTDDNSREGSDHPFSMNPKSWKDMVVSSTELFHSLGDKNKTVMKNELNTRVVQRRAIRSSKNLYSGSILKETDFVFLRPCPVDGLEPFRVCDLVDKKLKNNIPKGHIITLNDLTNS